MKKKDPALWAALRLQRILSPVAHRIQGDPTAAILNLLDQQQYLQRCWRHYQTALSRGWSHATETLQQRLIFAVAMVNAASRPLASPRTTKAPTAADILAEISSLEQDFDTVEILTKEKRIDVTTDEITLEGIFLGRFTIQLDFASLANRNDVSAFVIYAEDSNPASGDSSCTHPHVSDGRLCSGDATVPIASALSEGRIGDAFQLVDRVLHTYNPSSAYVALNSWDGQPCSDCGFITASNNLHFCEKCGSDFCDECIRSCERCRISICLGCSEESDDGDRLCPTCKETEKNEREEANEEEDEIAISDDSVHDPAEEQPQPQTEISHANSPDDPHAQPARLPGGATNGEVGTVTADLSEAQAA